MTIGCLLSLQMAALKASPFRCSSSTSSHSCFLSGNRSSLGPRFRRFSVKIPFFDGPLRSRLVSVCCHNPNSDSVVVDSSVSGYGPGSKSSTHFPDDHSPASAASPSSVIDFLTLCQRLKVLIFGSMKVLIFFLALC